MGMKTNRVTVGKYVDYLANAFMISKTMRYDVKGRRYIGSPLKYYAADPGLRNARINLLLTQGAAYCSSPIRRQSIFDGRSQALIAGVQFSHL